MLRAVATRSGPVTLAQSAVPSSVTGTTSETVLASVTIPGGMMGANGALRITAIWSHTNSANAKTLNVKLGGTLFQGYAPTTTTGTSTTATIRNRAAQNSQISLPNTISGLGTAATTMLTGAVDTSVDQVLTLRGTLALGTETITLEGYTVEVLPA